MGFGVLIEEVKEAVTQKGERGNDVGVTTGSLILEEAGVFAPVISDFTPAPMSADEPEPLFGRIAVDGLGAEVVAGSFVFGFPGGC